MKNYWQSLAALFGLAAVIAGAVGAHALSDEHAKQMVAEATVYALIHAAVLLYISRLPGRWMLAAKTAFSLGIALFSGGICAKYFTGFEGFGATAPVGGTCLMLGWAVLFLHAILDNRPTQT